MNGASGGILIFPMLKIYFLFINEDKQILIEFELNISLILILLGLKNN